MPQKSFEFCANCPQRDKEATINRYQSYEIRRFNCQGPLGDYAINGTKIEKEASVIFPICGLKTYQLTDPTELMFGGERLHILKPLNDNN